MLALLTGKQAPEFSQIQGWLNSQPLTIAKLKGKAVMLDFWTFGCINRQNTLPYVKELQAKYSGERFVLIGVHTPEFEYEKNQKNVEDAVKRFGIKYPVALDNENATWKLYGNQFWPRQTLIDASGKVRWEHVGEGDYEEMDRMVQELLKS